MPDTDNHSSDSRRSERPKMVATSSSEGSGARVDTRDVFIDLLRAGALVVVVVWHWVFTTVRWGAAGPAVDNPVSSVHWLWLVTWVAQPMCVFFAVGGFLHSKDRRGAREFWSARLSRLVPPAVPLLAFAAILFAGAQLADRGDLAKVVVLAVSPLWFLAVYLVLVALAPAARVMHQRFGVVAVAGAVVFVAVLDVARLNGWVTGWWVTPALFVGTWACVHQLGFHLGALRHHRGTAAAVSVTGLAGLVALSHFGPYPLAMVGSSADRMSNMGPPNLMVVALAAFQIGALCALAAPITGFARRHRARLEVVSAYAMPVYVWHLSAFCVFFAAAATFGVRNDTVDARWWAQRPLWLMGPALCCAALLGVLHRARVLRLPVRG